MNFMLPLTKLNRLSYTVLCGTAFFVAASILYFIGKPAFSERDSVILYLSEDKKDNHYFHQKYQYDDVFKDKNGNYYSYPKFRNTEDLNYVKENIKGFKTNLKNKKFNLKNLGPEVRRIYYPEEFYAIKNNFALPIKGINLNELISYRLKTSFKNL
ncbi:hypothetical protein [Chryseobacterium vaccae]|uniref:hypothetical protein n=1 Tax=Chryseobacterium vaccae TaxID=2604424 RepID=UPI001294B521|nr:hypothetical protein [Chryseobacterium vaccae]